MRWYVDVPDMSLNDWYELQAKRRKFEEDMKLKAEKE